MDSKQKTLEKKRKHEEENSEPSILKLNDDCWLEICRKLSLDDLCAVAETCTRLKAIACSDFQLTRQKIILDPENVELKQFCSVLRNFGNLVRIQMDYGDGALESLRLDSFHKESKGLPELKQIVKNLRNLKLYYCDLPADIFSHCKDLVTFDIFVSCSLDFKALKFPHLEKFVYREMHQADSSWLGHFILNHKHLKDLHLSGGYNEILPPLTTIGDNLKQLEKLCITILDDFYNFDPYLLDLTKLEHLKQLQITWETTSEPNIMNNTRFAESLEHIELSYVQLDDALITRLSKLQNVRVLKLRGTFDLSKELLEVLSNCGQLHELELHSASDGREWPITDSGVLSLVNKSPNLKILTFIGLEFVFSQKLYDGIVKIRRDRGKTEKLEITSIEDEQVADFDKGSNHNYVELRQWVPC